MDKLRAIQIFIDVCRCGSFARAAQIQGCSPSTVSKAIDRLELDLNALLFLRSTRQLVLTENGKTYLNSTKQLIEQLHDCESEISGRLEKPAGILKLNLAVPFGRLCVQPMLNKFCDSYPDINLHIQYNDEYVDMIEQGIDITIRTGKIDDSRLVGRKLSPLYLMTCAAKSYLREHGCPETLDQLESHRWIRLKFKQSGKLLPVTVKNSRGFIDIDPGRQIIVDNGESLAELCADGLGLAQLPHFAAKKFLHAKTLFPIFNSIKSTKYAIHLLYIKQAKTPAKVRLFIEFLQQYLKELGETPNQSWAAKIKS